MGSITGDRRFILKLGQTLSEEEYDHPSEDVWIAKSAKVHLQPASTVRSS